MTAAELTCLFEGHGRHLQPEAPEFPQRVERLVCARCDFETTDRAAVLIWKKQASDARAERFIAGMESEIPRFITEAMQ